ncbi:MAG: outer membrane beta-barrel protein [Bacteroidales bacterium]|jgi:hypothetical protein
MIKKITIYLILIFIFISSLCSQNKNELYIHLGYSQASQSPKIYSFYQTSYWRQNIHNEFVGAEYFRKIKNNSYIGIGFQIVEKGFKNKFKINLYNNLNIIVEEINYYNKYEYLEFPFLYKCNIKNSFLCLGILNSILLNCMEGLGFTDTYTNGSIKEIKGTISRPELYRKFDIGMLARIGTQIKKDLFLDISFTRGFRRVFIYNSDELNYNEVFMVGLNYKFM